MRHAREDYNRIQDPENLIPADEPVFLIRGKDAAGPEAVRAWAHRAKILGANQTIVDLAYGWAREMEAYQSTHSAQIPDLPADNQDLAAMDAAPPHIPPAANALVPYGLLADQDVMIVRITRHRHQGGPSTVDMTLREGCELEALRALHYLHDHLLAEHRGVVPFLDLKAAPPLADIQG